MSDLLEPDLPGEGHDAREEVPPEKKASAAPAPDSSEEAQRAVIAEVAVLDTLGSLATVAAGVILIVNADANPWWWLGVGLAAALIVISAAAAGLIPVRRRHRATRG